MDLKFWYLSQLQVLQLLQVDSGGELMIEYLVVAGGGGGGGGNGNGGNGGSGGGGGGLGGFAPWHHSHFRQNMSLLLWVQDGGQVATVIPVIVEGQLWHFYSPGMATVGGGGGGGGGGNGWSGGAGVGMEVAGSTFCT